MQDHAANSAPGQRPPASGAPEPGTTFDGRFAIERIVGRGGMGYVLLARHLELEQPVAIKLLSAERELDEKSSRRLLREARACARIKSQHVVRVLDVVSGGETPPYIVMEFLEGEDLARHLHRVRVLPPARAVEIVVQACEAVGEAHRLGVVHRDLKPGNLFLCERNAGHDVFVKVLDFGISKIDAAGSDLLTQSHSLLGSPSYAAPEQLEACHDVDARADIWSLGVILYELVAGRRPFEGATLAQVCTRILQDAPELPRSLPPTLATVIGRCLEKDPRRRYESIEALLEDLSPLAPAAARRAGDYLGALPRAAADSATLLKATAHESSSRTLTGTTQLHASATSSAPDSPRRARLAWVFVLLPISLLLAWLHGRASAPAAALPQRTTSAVTPVPVTALASASHILPKSSPLASTSAPREMESSPPIVRSPRAKPRNGSATAPPPTNSSGVPWVDSR